MQVYLIGAGVVGRAILNAHLRVGMPVCIADHNEIHLRESIAQLKINESRIQRTRLGHMPAIQIDGQRAYKSGPRIVIESVSERLDVKRSLFSTAERLFDQGAILCSNTSTLPISQIAAELRFPNRFCGMHFFMPVYQRDAVEIVRGARTDAETIHACDQHVRSLQKRSLIVADGPGFIVNRLLCPYFNETLTLLSRGVSAQQLDRAAKQYGMPMSPLELMDWFGARTVFDAGCVLWQWFPGRFDPSPLLPAMVKAKRFGRACGRGCYDYENGRRSDDLSPDMQTICNRYQRGESLDLSDDDVMLLLAVPMWIEAALAFREGVAKPIEQFDVAMSGGLGFQSSGTWLEFFESLGSDRILNIIDRFVATTKSLRAPATLLEQLKIGNPTQAIRAFAST